MYWNYQGIDMQFPQKVDAKRTADFGIIFSVLISLGIIALGTWLLRYELATPPGDDVGFFYEWQLANPTFWNSATAWIAFGIHQLLIWLTIWWAQERSDRKYTGTLKPVNLISLGINVFFIVLHYFQTMFFYDGIAQDLPSWTAQFTVIMMLFIILAMENRRRGIFFGKKINFRKEFYHWLKKYHGYAFSFAVIYTFWFHPMIPTWGHLLGFVQVILVMVQGSLMFTKIHVNRKWIFLLEILVLPHAASVALNQGGDIIWMFLFGFMTMFIVTQMHGLGLKPWVKRAFTSGYVALLLLVYVVMREPYMINEVIRIPMIEYGMVFLTYWGWLLFARFTGTIDRFRSGDESTPASAAGD